MEWLFYNSLRTARVYGAVAQHHDAVGGAEQRLAGTADHAQGAAELDRLPCAQGGDHEPRGLGGRLA